MKANRYNTTQPTHDAKLLVSSRILSLPIEKKHELAAGFFVAIKMREFSEEHKEFMNFLESERLKIYEETTEQHGYAGSEYLAAKRVLSLIYG